MKTFAKFPKTRSISFFAACFLLFLLNQFYLVLQVSAIMKSAGSVVLLSSVMTAMAIPRIIMLPICGYLMDKIGAVKILRGGIYSLIFTLLSYFVFSRLNLIHTNHIFLFAILFGGISAAIAPTLYAMVPLLSSDGNLQRTNSILQTANQAALLSGPALAGIVIKTIDERTYLLMAAMAIVSSALSSAMGVHESEKRNNGGGQNVGQPPRVSYAAVFRTPDLILMLLFSAVLNLCIIGPQQIGYPIVAGEYLTGGIDRYPMLLSVNGLGALGGSFFVGRLKRYENTLAIQLLLWCALLLGFVWGAFGSAASEPIILGAAFCAGLIFGTINVLFMTALQQMTPNTLIGSVMGIQFLCSVGLQPVSYTLTGLFLNHMPINGLYLISGGSIVFISVIMLFYNRQKKDRDTVES